MRKLWGGAFEEPSNALVDRFGGSLELDLEFFEEDLLGSIAHARMLGATGIVAESEADALIGGLEAILAEGPESLPRDVEDIHTAVEVRLGELVGDVAGKLHTARSRNDQVATDARLAMRRRLTHIQDALKDVQGVLLDLATRHKNVAIPGYTHQQRAQPISLGFHWMAHFWALQRHGVRSRHLMELSDACPLGSAALAGTAFPIDRWMTAAELGFSRPTPNALDATSDRSLMMDALHLCALVMIDLSRVSQELVLWSTHEFGFVRLSDQVTTGSSIMPQKRNPDMAELIRGRSAQAIGAWTTLAATMKALPLGYNRDTQDDKPPLFAMMRLTLDSLMLVKLMLQTATWDEDRIKSTMLNDFSTATDLADWLATNGMPFRQAHDVVGRVARSCRSKGWGLEDLTPEQLAQIAPEVPAEALDVLKVSTSWRRRESEGGAGPKSVAAQIRRARALHRHFGFDSAY